ncbi:hypothetical protein BKA70DRAFT_1527467 [Coprinopsis sp. MPI-PUGE-AT-0042]|nr:hypothetical protein BKA70DRAFT_1527467 [Coprinopsis sp. MPI-PUGE-AT-0042]
MDDGDETSIIDAGMGNAIPTGTDDAPCPKNMTVPESRAHSPATAKDEDKELEEGRKKAGIRRKASEHRKDTTRRKPAKSSPRLRSPLPSSAGEIITFAIRIRTADDMRAVVLDDRKPKKVKTVGKVVGATGPPPLPIHNHPRLLEQGTSSGKPNVGPPTREPGNTPLSVVRQIQKRSVVSTAEDIHAGLPATINLPPNLTPATKQSRRSIPVEYYPKCAQLKVSGMRNGVPGEEDLVKYPGVK